jgi:putative endonuclease
MRTRQPAVYILASRMRGTLYIGVTSDLPQRIGQHREGVAGFTARHSVHLLAWFEPHPSMESAIRREKAMKEWKRAWKLRLVEDTNPRWRDLYPDIL